MTKCITTLCAAVCLLVPPAWGHMISATITADNHYALFVGNADGSMMSLVGGNELGAGGSPGTYNWSEPESVLFTTDLDTLYLATWSDDSVAQGVLGELDINGFPLLTGDFDRWGVFATGADKDDGAAYPTESEMATQVALANSNSGGPGTSGGWTSIQVGGMNGVSPWGTLSTIDSGAQWMWWTDGEGSAFMPGGDHDEFLIFRTSIAAVPVPGAALLGVLGLSTVAWLKRRAAKA